MTHNQYAPSGLANPSENTLNRRSQSFLAQTCNNYPPSSHLSSTQYAKPSLSSKTPPPGQYASHYKENLLQAPRKTIISTPIDEQQSNLRIENERLRKQLQQQKDHYQQEIVKLRKNITMKDQLLDECEAEIVHLKNTYHKFIQQNLHVPPPSKQQSHQKIPEPPQIQNGQQTAKIQPQATNAQKVDAGLIPLSIVPKRSSSQRELSSGGRPVHGLIRRG